MSDELVEWLRKQLDEDQRAAEAATPGPWSVDDESYAGTIYGANDVAVVAGGRWGGEASVFESAEDALHIARHDPARVLREVEAKRKTVEQAADWISCGPVRETEVDRADDAAFVKAGETMLRLLTLPYADRPGYREEWKP